MTFRVFLKGREDCLAAKGILFTEAGLHANWTAKTGDAIRRSLRSGTWERGESGIELKAVRDGPASPPEQASLF